MTRMTTVMRNQVERLRSAADGGLPWKLASFMHFTLDAVERLEYSSISRKQMQAYIDTLIDLIDTKVNNP